jgi:uncharacterized membrane protein YfcA
VPDLLQSVWDWLDLGLWQLLVALGATLLAGSISGLTGFGFGLVIVPILLLLFEPATVVVLTGVLAVASGLPILAQDRAMVRSRIVMPLLIPALIGALTGVRLLTSLDSTYIKLIAGIVVVVFALMVARGFVIPGIRSRVAPLVAGYVSGVLGTSTGMSGPPVVLFLTDRTPEPRVFRASITAYFAATNTVGVSLVLRTGVVGARELGIAGVLLPVALAGRRIGQHLHNKVDMAQFRAITLGLLVVTGTSGTITALAGLLG